VYGPFKIFTVSQTPRRSPPTTTMLLPATLITAPKAHCRHSECIVYGTVKIFTVVQKTTTMRLSLLWPATVIPVLKARRQHPYITISKHPAR
jgi:hypothetical protein